MMQLNKINVTAINTINRQLNLTMLCCFCTQTKYSGNLAGVIQDFSGSDIDAISLAKQFNLPVLACVYSTPTIPLIRFFYPTTEMTSCIHGTMAVAKILLDDLKQSSIKLQNKDGVIIEVKQTVNNNFQVVTAVLPHKTIVIDKQLIINMLNLPSLDYIDETLFCGIASIGSPKLFVPVSSLTILHNIIPRFDAITKWSVKHGINGLYVYTPQTLTSTANFHARAFNPLTGNNEDAATGVAAGALAGILKTNLQIEQGYTMNTPSLIKVTYINPNQILIGGKVNITD